MKEGILVTLITLLAIVSSAVIGGVHSDKIRRQEMVSSREIPGGQVIIDARPVELYNIGHIPTAISIPADSGSLPNSPKEKKTIVYCSGMGCKDSSNLAKRLKENGWKNVKIYEGGWEEWVITGHEVEKSDVL